MGKWSSYRRRTAQPQEAVAPFAFEPPTLQEGQCVEAICRINWTNADPYDEQVEIQRSSNGIDFAFLLYRSSDELSWDDENTICPSAGTLWYRLRYTNAVGTPTSDFCTPVSQNGEPA